MKIVNKIEELNNEIQSGDVFYDKSLKAYYLLTRVGTRECEDLYSIISLERQGNIRSQDTSLLSFDKIKKEIDNRMNCGELIHTPYNKYEFTLIIESKYT